MIKLAALALKSPVSAAWVSTGLLFLGLVLPVLAGPAGVFGALLLIWSSAAVLALVLLRKGLQPALISVLAAVLLIGVLSLVASGSLTQLLLITVQFWLPALLVSWVLRKTVSLEIAVFAAAAIGICSVLYMYIAFGDPEALWQDLLAKQFDVAGTAQIEGMTPEIMQQITARMARLATPATAIMMMVTAISSVLLARAWQAGLFNPGGFQQEFHRLRFGKQAAIAVLVLSGLSMLLKIPMLSNVTVVLMTVFVFQGLAVVHSLVKTRKMATGWLIGCYMMLILPHTLALLGALGLADNWLNLRKLDDTKTDEKTEKTLASENQDSEHSVDAKVDDESAEQIAEQEDNENLDQDRKDDDRCS